MATVLSEEAAKLILGVMKQSGLDPEIYSLDLRMEDESLKLGWVDDSFADRRQHGIRVCFNDADVLVDVFKDEGRIGLIFKGLDE